MRCQQAFSKPCLVNLISKDTHLVFSIPGSFVIGRYSSGSHVKSSRSQWQCQGHLQRYRSRSGIQPSRGWYRKRCYTGIVLILSRLIIPPANFVCGGYYTPPKLCLWWVYCFHVVRACVRPSVRNVLFP